MIKILEIAAAEVGYVETPANSNKTKYGEWFGYNGVAWCGIYVSWCFDQAGMNLGNIGFLKGFAGCQTAVAHFKKTGEVTENPVPGDICFFDWNGSGKYRHVGIYKKGIDKWKFESFEGNTSIGNQSNGGQVMLRKRNYAFVLFVHPMVADTLS